MALATLASLPVACREWLLFETASSHELGVENLENAGGMYSDDLFDAPSLYSRRATEATPTPLLVPEFDNGEYVLGHCYALTCVDSSEFPKVFPEKNPHGELFFERPQIEQRFTLTRGEGDMLVTVMVTLYADGAMFVNYAQMGSDLSHGHLAVRSWMCSRGDLNNPEVMLACTASKLCKHHKEASQNIPMGIIGCRHLSDVEKRLRHPQCNCQPFFGPQLPPNNAPVDSMWQFAQGYSKRFVDGRLLVKTMSVFSLANGDSTPVEYTKDALVVHRKPVRVLRTMSHFGMLDGARLQRLKTEYVQTRLDSMISFGIDMVSAATAPARRFNALLRLANSTVANDALELAETTRSGVLALPSPPSSSTDELLHFAAEGSAGSPPSKASLVISDGSWSAQSVPAGAFEQSNDNMAGCARAVCSACNASFARRYELDRHVKSVHYQEKRHSCKECSRGFFQRSHLLAHVREVHEGRRDHACDRCGRQFASVAKLRRHCRMVHLQDRSHVCTLCGTGFSQKSDLQRHSRTRHATSAVA